jgi:hypothetical protein
VAEQTSDKRRFTCVVATTGREGGDGITMVTVCACDYGDAASAVRQVVAVRFGCTCELLDIEPPAA